MQIKTGKSYLCRTGNHMVEIRESTTYNCKPCFYGTIWFLTPGQTFATEGRPCYTHERFWPTGQQIGGSGGCDAVAEVRIIPRLCDANTGEPMGQERLEVVDDDDTSPDRFSVDAQEAARARQESDILLDDGTWLVVIPRTPFAAQIWARGTEWYTTWGDPRGRNPNMRCRFNEDTRDGPLVTVMNRANPGERYQYYSWPTDLLVDGDDRRVEPDDIVGLGRANPALVRVLIPHVTELAAAFGNPDEQLAAVRRNCHAIRHIADPTEDMKMAAIERSGRALEHIADPTEAMQLAAVHQEGFFITFIKDPTEAAQLVAVSKDSMIIGSIANPCEAAIRLARSRGRDRRGMHVRRVKAPSMRTQT